MKNEYNVCQLELVGTQNAPELRESSQLLPIAAIDLSSVADLLGALEINPPSEIKMLRSTAGRFSDFIELPINEITISCLADRRADFREFLRKCKYSQNSVRSYSNYLSILLKRAMALGWKPEPTVIPYGWQAILAAVAVEGCSDIVSYAIRHKKRPEEFSDKDLSKWSQETINSGQLSYSSVRAKTYRFRTTIGKAGLIDKLPALRPIRKRYGISLKDFPEPLRREVEELFRWKQSDFAPGRPKDGQHRPVTTKRLRLLLGQLLGYSRIIGVDPEATSLTGLVTEDLLTRFVGWSIDERNCQNLAGDIGVLYAALRHNPRYKEHDFKWFEGLARSIARPSEEGIAERKATKYLAYAVVERIPKKIHEQRAQALKAGAPALADKRLALTVRDELLMRWLIVQPWRQRNLRECRIGGERPNLFKAIIPSNSPVMKAQWVREAELADPETKFWQFRFSKKETKTGNTIHCVLPSQLVSLLEEYMNKFRPHLVEDGDPETLFVNRDGREFSSRQMCELISDLTVRYGGRRVTPHLFRDIVAYEWLTHRPEDYLTVSKLLWHRNINTTLKIYGRRFDESSAACRMDEWLRDREQKS
jgi:integrase